MTVGSTCGRIKPPMATSATNGETTEPIKLAAPSSLEGTCSVTCFPASLITVRVLPGLAALAARVKGYAKAKSATADAAPKAGPPAIKPKPPASALPVPTLPATDLRSALVNPLATPANLTVLLNSFLYCTQPISRLLVHRVFWIC